MKKLLLITIIFAGGLSVFSQSVTNASISGTFTEDKTLTGYYDYEEDTLTGPTYSYEWLSYDNTGGDEQDLGENSTSYLIANADIGRRLRFIVHLTNSFNNITLSDTSALSPAIIANSTPVANNVFVSVPSNLNVGSTLICTYDYYDADGDLEDNTTFQWRRADTETGTYSSITGATDYTYVIQLADTGKWFKVRVNPDALTGANNSDNYNSAAAAGPVQNAPYVDGVSILSTIQSGNDLTVSYNFHDPDGDGDISEFTWYRDNVEIPGANGSTYSVVSDDQGSKIKVTITPISDAGFPNIGEDVTSNECDVEVSSLPLAEGVCISGNRSADAVLTGVYTYNANGSKSEGGSRLLWYVDDILVKENSRWTTNANKLTLSGGRESKKIVFKVVPRTTYPAVIGDTTSSSALTIITNTKVNYSVSESREELTALPAADKFLGNGVIKDAGIYYFNPGHTDVVVGTPNEITHQYTDGVCTQNAYIDFNVDSATVFFDNGFKSFFCYEDTDVTIGVTGLASSNAVSGSGVFFLSPNIPGGIISQTPETVRINPQVIGPGINQAVLLYQYLVEIPQPIPFPSILVPYVIARPMIIEFIDQNLDIGNLPLEYCEEGEPLTAISLNKIPAGGTGDWSSPLIISENTETALLDPSAGGPGLKTISYTYTTQIGCSKTVSKDILINPTPQLDFDIGDGCIESDTDTTLFINNSPDSLSVAAWFWEFGETFTQVSEDFEPGFMYRTEGKRDVTLIGTTFKGCIDTLIKEIALGVKPEGDFYWEDDCFSPGTDLKLFDKTKPNSTIDSLFWVLNHSGGSDTIFNVLNPTYAKQLPEILEVDYYLLTKYFGCSDTVMKDIYIRPTFTLSDGPYSEDFESAGLSWVPDTSYVSTWEKGIPDYHTSSADGMAWYTDTLLGGLVEYSVESPCFDFTGVSRPMIKLDIIRKFDEGRDGAVLQYKEGNNPVWQNIGGTDFGHSWYANSNISGRPGGSVVGWSPELKDVKFQQARQYLDELIGKTDIKFRVSYGSDGNAQNSRGFAFDNVWIGKRTRNVLVEHFTNYNYQFVVDEDNALNGIIDGSGNDAMNIQYHTNYRAGDQLYLDNSAVPSARMLFYSLVRNPFTIFDGGTSENYANKYDWDIADATLNDLKDRSLTDPLFLMKIDTLPNYRFSVDIEPLQDLQASNMTLYLAVVAKEITTLTGTNGQTVFKNVLRKMIPDAGGISLKKDWLISEGPTSMGPYSRNVSMLYDSDSIEVIAFLQNNITKEVYQATTTGSLATLSTSIGRVGFDEATFKIFPNPASTNLTFLFDREISAYAELKFYNSTGIVVKEIQLPPGVKSRTIDDLALPNGIYIIKLTIDSKPQGYRKLIISNR